MRNLLLLSILSFMVILYSCNEPKKSDAEQEVKNDKFTYSDLKINDSLFFVFRLNTYTGEVFVRNGKNGIWNNASQNNELKIKKYNLPVYELNVEEMKGTYRLILGDKAKGKVYIRSHSSAWFDASAK